MDRLLQSSAPAATIFIRLAAGAVFFTEGIQKFIYPDALGVGRFIKIGIPAPQFFAPFVGVVEIVCGAMFLAGLLTRLAAIPLIIDMVVAILATKVPIFVKTGFWNGSHESRLDVAMLLSSLYLVAAGAGALSMDARLSSSPSSQKFPQLAG